MTYPDEMPVDRDEEGDVVDASQVSAALTADASEADVIEQAIAVPLGEDDFDR